MDAMLLIKASLVLAATLLAARLLRGAPAAARHRLWTVAFAAVLTLPLLASVLPALYVPVPACCGAPNVAAPLPRDLASPAPGPAARMGNDTIPTAAPTPDPPEAPPAGANGASRPDVRAVLLTAWMAGTLAAACLLCVSLVRVRRLARRSEDLRDEEWRASADALGARMGLRRPVRLFIDTSVGTPMAGGVWRPVIFLPSSARGWTAERRDVVLAHELAHLACHDPLRHLAARLAVACYWFHPLAWIAARHAAAAREQACDEAVLALGTRPSAYARVLLELAESLQPSPAGLGALPMVDRSHMETRIMAILNDDIRPANRRRVVMPAAAVALLALGVSAAQPAIRASAPAMGENTVPIPAALTVVSAVEAPGASGVAQAAPVQLEAGRDSACWSDDSGRVSFSGYSDMSRVGGRFIIREQIGTRGPDRVIQKNFGDMRLCMLAEGTGDRSSADRPSQWPGRARRVVLEAQRRGVVQRLEIAGPRTSWQVGGQERVFDAAAQQWRDRMFAALDTTWELSTLRGEVSSLRGEISSIRGEESSLRGEISSLHGHVSSLRGEQSSTRGEVSSLRGQISSIRGHVSSLRGAISSERGSISSLYSRGYQDAQIAKHEKAIQQLEEEIRAYRADDKVADVERQIKALDADSKVAAIEAQIRAFDLDAKVAAIERRIGGLDVDGKIAAIERRITALDADRRGKQLEDRRDDELKRLEAALAAIR